MMRRIKRFEQFSKAGKSVKIHENYKYATLTEGSEDGIAICKSKINSMGTHVFKARYNNFAKCNTGGYIGVVKSDYNLDWKMTFKGAWALYTSGILFLDGKESKTGTVPSNSTVTVEVNIAAGTLRYLVEGKEVSYSEGLTFPSPLYFACEFHKAVKC